MHIFIALLVNKWSSSPVKTAVNFKIFPFHLWYFFSRKCKRVGASEYTKESQRTENGANTKKLIYFFFFLSPFFSMGCCLWLTAETFDASQYPQNQHTTPQSHEFSTEKLLQHFGVPAVITADSNKLPVMSNSKNLLWQLYKEHD